MNFRDYKWFNNPRGLRNDGPYTPLNPDRYSGPKMGWAKLMVGGTEHVGAVSALLARGCMPIIQIYRERMGAAPADEAWYPIYEQYARAGALWFELYDEPNAEHFWPLGADGRPSPAPDWANRDGCIGPLMDHWLDWAERIAAMGAYPAFPAMFETTIPQQATAAWVEACLSYLAQAHAARFGQLIANGLWVAVHPFVLNHFYQEPPGGPPAAARPYYQQSYREGGWHFEYPYDPIQQHIDPGRTPLGGTPGTPFGDPNGLVATGEIFTELLKKTFAAGPVPVLGTAGGIWPIPAPGADPVQADSRYYGYSRDSHGEATVAMFRWLAEQGPPWLLGLALSTEGDYYGQGAAVPAIELLLAEPPAMKEAPDLDIAPGRAVQAMAAPEASPLDPFAAEPPSGEVVPEEAETAALQPEADVFPFDLESLFPTSPPAPSPQVERGDVAPVELETPSEAEPPVTALITPEPQVTALAEQEPPITTLAEHEPPITTLTTTETPEPAPEEEIAPTTAMWPAPEAREEVHAPPPEVIAMPAETGAPEPGPEPVMEEVAPLEPAPDEAIAPTTAMWPAPEAREEIHAPPPEVIAMPAETSAPEPEPEPAMEEVAPLEPAPDEEIAPTTAMWPAPEAREEVVTEVPPVEPAAPLTVMSSDLPPAVPAEKLGPGPGPAYDIISEHWLMPAPELPSGWLLSAVRRYWDVFRSPIVADASLIGALPPEKSLAVTLIASRAEAEPARQRIAAEWPNVRIDVVAGDTASEIQAELDRRAREGKEFG